MDPQPSHKHHCRICNKGFGCGRALGGHMRAHGINDDPAGGQGDGADDNPSTCGGDWDGKLSPPSGSRRMYALRTNPNRLRTCRACGNCGKEFSSWKAFLEHGNGRCASLGEVDPGDESMVSSLARSDVGAAAEDDDDPDPGCPGWSKGKRSRRSKAAAAGGAGSSCNCLSSQEEDLANCLVMLSAGRVEPVETEESCASASREEDHLRNPVERMPALPAMEKPKPAGAAPRGMFECKACKKVFSSHQALGGHRASHKKVKGCFAARLADLDDSPCAPDQEDVLLARDDVASAAANGIADEAAGLLAIVPLHPAAAPPAGSGGSPKKKSKLHECSICHRVFTSGQALGGHKRCHWLTSNTSPDPASVVKLHQMQAHAHAQNQHLLQLRPMFHKSEPLDLNLPATADGVARARPEREAPLPLDVPELLLQPWTTGSNKHDINANTAAGNATFSNNMNTSTTLNDVADDEADSKVKLARLSDLKDMQLGSDSSSWLQVGIGSSSKRARNNP